MADGGHRNPGYDRRKLSNEAERATAVPRYFAGPGSA